MDLQDYNAFHIVSTEKNVFNKIQRGKSPALRKKQLMELHRRIVGKIGKIEDDKGNKRIGIILNANKYLDDKINAILLNVNKIFISISKSFIISYL